MQHRKPARLRGFDYSAPGAYFVTVCTHERREILAKASSAVLELTPSGRAVERCWQAIPVHFDSVELDVFVVMPNHLHGVLVLTTRADTHPLPSIVGSFKSAVTREVFEEACAVLCGNVAITNASSAARKSSRRSGST